MEYWDLYDGAGRPLQQRHMRGQPLPPGAWFQAVSVWVVNSLGDFLLTLRSPEKEASPGCWENSGGAVVAGETSLQGALRELGEETGIQASPGELHFLSTQLREPMRMDVYLLRRDAPLSSLSLQPGETVDACWATAAELEVMARDGRLAPPIARTLAQIRPCLEQAIARTDRPTAPPPLLLLDQLPDHCVYEFVPGPDKGVYWQPHFRYITWEAFASTGLAALCAARWPDFQFYGPNTIPLEEWRLLQGDARRQGYPQAFGLLQALDTWLASYSTDCLTVYGP